MVGKKNKRANKPLSGRKKHKLTAAYLKPNTVGVDETRGHGSSYRAKLRARQHGGSEGQRDAGFEFVEAARPVAANGFDRSPEPQPRLRRHESYKFDHSKPATVLVTESYNGPASRTTRVFDDEIGPVEAESMRFKPCFLVAEQVESHGMSGTWRISRFTGLSDPEGDFRGAEDFITEVQASEREIAEELAKWCKGAGNQPSSMPNYLFPEAKKVSAHTEAYGRGAGRRLGGGFSDFNW